MFVWHGPNVGGITLRSIKRGLIVVHFRFFFVQNIYKRGLLDAPSTFVRHNCKVFLTWLIRRLFDVWLTWLNVCLTWLIRRLFDVRKRLLRDVYSTLIRCIKRSLKECIFDVSSTLTTTFRNVWRRPISDVSERRLKDVKQATLVRRLEMSF